MQANLLASMFLIGTAVGGPATGLLADRVGPKPVLVSCAALQLVATVVLVVANQGPPSVWGASLFVAGASPPALKRVHSDNLTREG